MIGRRPTPNRHAATPAHGRPPKKAPSRVAVLRVDALPGDRAHGRLVAGSTVIRCAFGPAGIVRDKREGDGATPAGTFTLKTAMIRSDRLARPGTRLPLRAVRPDDGWCDDVASPLYNRPVRRPFHDGHEAMWRADGLYDCVVVIDHNVRPARRGRGSAIFFHVAAPGLKPTAGCVAIPRAAMLRLLPRLGPETRMIIG